MNHFEDRVYNFPNKQISGTTQTTTLIKLRKISKRSKVNFKAYQEVKGKVAALGNLK